MSLLIRHLYGREQSIALEVMTQCFEEGNRSYAEQALAAAVSGSPDAPVSFIALKEDAAVGHVQIVKSPLGEGRFSLLWLAVLPDMRRQGIGAALVSHAENHVKRMRSGMPGSMNLVSECNNAYYENLGYHNSGEMHNRHPVMVKEIG